MFKLPSLTRADDAVSGGSPISPYAGEWSVHREIVSENWYWYSGDFRKERVGEPAPDGTPAPLAYPLGISLLDMLARMKGGMLLGEYGGSQEMPLNIAFRSSKGTTKEGREIKSANASLEKAEEAWDEICEVTPLGPMIVQEAVECWLNGISWFQVKRQLIGPPKIVRRDDDFIYPEWHPDNPLELTRLTMKTPCGRAVAEEELKKAGKPTDNLTPFNTYEEIWTQETLTICYNGVPVRQEKNVNKDRFGKGMIPFVHIPTYLVGHEFYGETLGPGVISLMKELNLRMADVGDSVEYGAHPTKWIRDFRGKKKELPVGADAIWDLGRTLGDSKPEAGILEAKGISPVAFEYIDKLLAMFRMTGHFTPVDIGDDEGSQRSGATLEVRKAPGLHITRMVRVNWVIGFKRLVQMALLVYAQSYKQIKVPPLKEIEVTFAPELPRDRADIINEIVSLAGLPKPMISPEQVIDLLGRKDPEGELARILAIHAEEKAQREQEMKMQQEQHQQQLEMGKAEMQMAKQKPAEKKPDSKKAA